MSISVSEQSVSPATGRYLYAILEAGSEQELSDLQGLDGGSVYFIHESGVGAAVSDLPNRRIRPERRKVGAHHEVLKQLMREHTVLPMAFGLIAEGPESVRRILRLNRDAFVSQLRRVRGKVEMGLRIAWDIPNVFEQMVVEHPDLCALRDHIFRGGREPAQDEKIELGRMFDRLMNADRAQYQERVERLLRPVCAEVAVNPPRNEREILNLACLIDRDAQKEFEQRVIQAARVFDDRFALDFNGPWPPHNFVELDLQL